MTELEELARSWAITLQTRKRDGTWVPATVNLVTDNGRAFFRSYDASGKAKRLRNFSEVRVAPSTMTGKVRGPLVTGRASLLDGESVEAKRAAALLARRHPLLQGRLVPAFHKRKGYRTLYYELTLERN
jgi:PPOX class probable F420-dependent enzyme